MTFFHTYWPASLFRFNLPWRSWGDFCMTPWWPHISRSALMSWKNWQSQLWLLTTCTNHANQAETFFKHVQVISNLCVHNNAETQNGTSTLEWRYSIIIYRMEWKWPLWATIHKRSRVVYRSSHTKCGHLNYAHSPERSYPCACSEYMYSMWSIGQPILFDSPNHCSFQVS